MLFLFDKTYLSPARLLSVFALAIAFHSVFAILQAKLGSVSRRLCALGRNSLAVFSVASLLSLAGQLIRFATQGGIVTDIAMILSGLWFLGLTAWFVEWRSRPQVSSRG
ncbi:MAG: OpgC domain-containing protein [Hyphomicrobium sp.]